MPDESIKPLNPTNGKPDPTGNVLLLVEASSRRQDDLAAAESRRVDEVMASELKAVRQEVDLRAAYDAKLREAESKRIDAIRSVDVNNVAIESERQAAQANVLATQVAASAEALRALVAATAATIAQQLTQLTTQLTERLAALEKAQYEGTGKQAVADPLMANLLIEMKAMRESSFERKGSGTGMKDMGAWIFAGVMAIVTLISVAFGIISKLN